MIPETILAVAKEVVDGKSRSYVQAAQTLATFLVSTKEAADRPCEAETATPESARLRHTCYSPASSGSVLDFRCEACTTALHTGGFDALLAERLGWARRGATVAPDWKDPAVTFAEAAEEVESIGESGMTVILANGTGAVMTLFPAASAVRDGRGERPVEGVHGPELASPRDEAPPAGSAETPHYSTRGSSEASDPRYLVHRFRERSKEREQCAAAGQAADYGADYSRQELRVANIWSIAADEVEAMLRATAFTCISQPKEKS